MIMNKKNNWLIIALFLGLIIAGCNANTGDITPPVFSGAKGLIYITPTGIPAIGASHYFLTWEAAADNITPPNKIVYLIFAYTGSLEAFDWTAIYATTEAGITSYEVSAPVYYLATYFAVRAKDEAGNIDANTVLVSTH
jgi:hypothetical protein